MKKYLLVIGFFTFLAAIPLSVNAKVKSVPGPWDLSGSHTLTLTCTLNCTGDHPHTMNVTSMNLVTGEFSGNGYINENPSITWQVNGTVTDSSLTFTIIYDGPNPWPSGSATGVIDSSGGLSGEATSTIGHVFSWVITPGAIRFEGDHGQWVSFQENKQEAAELRVGMPDQSKGHTK